MVPGRVKQLITELGKQTLGGTCLKCPSKSIYTPGQSGWMFGVMFSRKFQGNFNKLYTGILNGMINEMGSFTKTSMESFKGTLKL